jgi:LacI family transcriptional regulator
LRKTTIEDVARLAGVSIKTVSRVVNREPSVRPATGERVGRAIAELGYRPNAAARNLASSRSFLVGLLYVNPASIYMINILSGAVAACRAAGFDLLIHPCDYASADLTSDIMTFVRETNPAGLILTPPLSDLKTVLAALDEVQMPLVRIAPGDPADIQRSVYTNDEEACAELTEYLVSLGHRKIAFISGHPDHEAVQMRLRGYKRGMQDAGLPVLEAMICQGDNLFASGYKCGERLLRQKDRPTAIMAGTDDMAAGVIRVAHELGIRIPEDLSITGFDDIPLAEAIWPALTTIRQPTQIMGEKATELLLASFRPVAADDDGEICRVASEIVVRESTGPGPAL